MLRVPRQAHARAAQPTLAPEGRVVQHDALGVAAHEGARRAALPLGPGRGAELDALEARGGRQREEHARRHQTLAGAEAHAKQPAVEPLDAAHRGAQPRVEPRAVLPTECLDEQRRHAAHASAAHPPLLRRRLHLDQEAQRAVGAYVLQEREQAELRGLHTEQHLDGERAQAHGVPRPAALAQPGLDRGRVQRGEPACGGAAAIAQQDVGGRHPPREPL